MKRPVFINNEIYHVYNRGTDKRRIFMGEDDYFRFIHDLYEFNDTISAEHLYNKQRSLRILRSLEVGLPKNLGGHKRQIIVEVLAFCLMFNHYHLLIRQIADRGIERFMQKLGTGYTNYFNNKYERSGVLFQGKFKAVHVTDEAQLLHIPYYIHCNPLDLIEPNWRDRGIKDIQKAIKFLETYRWSSFFDYIGRKNFPSVISRDFIAEIVGKPTEYRKETKEWLKARKWYETEDLWLE